MAKGKRNKEEVAEAGGPARGLLEVAWRAYQSGDAVLTRRAARQLLAGTPREADEALARKVAKELFVGAVEADADAKKVAAELASRTRAPLKPYLFALLAAAIWLLMVLITHRG